MVRFNVPYASHSKKFDSLEYWYHREVEATEQEYAWLCAQAGHSTSKEFEHLSQHLREQKIKLDAQVKHKKSLLNHGHVKDEIQFIDKEIAEWYSDQCTLNEVQDLNNKKWNHLIFFSAYHRLRFLLEKRRYLVIHNNSFNEILPPLVESVEKTTWIKSFFDRAKKLADPIDDIWNVLKGAINPEIVKVFGAFFVGAPNFIIHLGEGYYGAKEAYSACKNEKIKQRKTRMVSNTLGFLFAGAGAGLALSLIVGGAGMVVSGTVMMTAPVLVPGLLAGIYGLALWRKAYIFDRVKKEEGHAFVEYKNKHTHHLLLLNKLKNEIHHLETKKWKMMNKVDSVIEKQKNNETLTEGEQHRYFAYKKIIDDLLEKEAVYAQLKGIHEGEKQRYQDCREVRLKAERELAFKAVEVTASVLVVVGGFFAAAALIGASVASFGAVPLALLVTGVAVGFICKMFENKDESKNFVYTRQLRNWFVKKWENIKNMFSTSPKKYRILEVREEKNVLPESKYAQVSNVRAYQRYVGEQKSNNILKVDAQAHSKITGESSSSMKQAIIKIKDSNTSPVQEDKSHHPGRRPTK